MMSKAVIIDAVRTPIGKLGGSLKNVEADYLGADVLNAIVNRTGVNPELIDEIVLGQGKQSTDTPNLARVAALRAKLPIHIPGYTVHRR